MGQDNTRGSPTSVHFVFGAFRLPSNSHLLPSSKPALYVGVRRWRLTTDDTHATPQPDTQPTDDNRQTDRRLLLRAARLVAAAPLSPPSSAVAVEEALWTPPVPSTHNRGLPRVWASLFGGLLCCLLNRRTVRSPLRRYSARSVSNDTAESPTDVVFVQSLRGTSPQTTDCNGRYHFAAGTTALSP